jgi:hypothetical protein
VLVGDEAARQMQAEEARAAGNRPKHGPEASRFQPRLSDSH